MKVVDQSLDDVVAALSPLAVDWMDEVAGSVIAKLAALPAKPAYDRDDVAALLDQLVADLAALKTQFAL